MSGLIAKLTSKLMSGKAISAMAEKMILGAIGSGENEKVYRLDRVQIEKHSGEIVDTPDIVLRTFYINKRELIKTEKGEVEQLVSTIEPADTIIGNLFDQIKAIPGAAKIAEKIDPILFMGALKAFIPNSSVYILCGKNLEFGYVEVGYVTITPDGDHVPDIKPLSELLPGWIEQAKAGGFLNL